MIRFDSWSRHWLFETLYFLAYKCAAVTFKLIYFRWPINAALLWLSKFTGTNAFWFLLLSLSSQPTFVFRREATSKDDFVCSTFHTSVTFITLVSIVTASLCLNPLSTYIYSIVHCWGPLATMLIKTTILNPNFYAQWEDEPLSNFLHSENKSAVVEFSSANSAQAFTNTHNRQLNIPVPFFE